MKAVTIGWLAESLAGSLNITLVDSESLLLKYVELLGLATDNHELSSKDALLVLDNIKRNETDFVSFVASYLKVQVMFKFHSKIHDQAVA